MYKVHALWLADKEHDMVAINSFDKLISVYSFIGFIPDGNVNRYFIITTTEMRGMACRPQGIWSTKQGEAPGKYFLFDSAAELFEWMKG